MATRPVFLINQNKPYFSEYNVNFIYNNGFAPCQKRKNIIAIHDAFHKDNSDKEILEISSKSFDEVGVNLSAFNLTIYVESLGKRMPVEIMYHSGKIYKDSGRHLEILNMSPRESKKYLYQNKFGSIEYFIFENQRVEVDQIYAFYNWLYNRALLENEDIASELLRYEAFTDVEYNPNRSKNCQARSAAIFVSLFKQGKIQFGEELDYGKFRRLIHV